MLINRIGLVAVLATLLAGFTGAISARAEAAPEHSAGESAAAVRVEVSLSGRTLQVLRGSEVLASYDVAVGKSKHPTPKGEFRLQRVVWNPRWVPPKAEWARDAKPREPGDPNNPMGRVKIFFQSPDYYVHGTHDEKSIGTASSHGCIRMRNRDVIALARLVMEHGGEARPPGWFKRVINYVRSTREVQLSQPVPFAVKA